MERLAVVEEGGDTEGGGMEGLPIPSNTLIFKLLFV